MANNNLPEDIDSYLDKRYYDIRSPAAFTSVRKLYDTIKSEGIYDIPLKRIREWGMSQDAITLNKRPVYKGLKRRKVVTGLTDCIWDVDLLQLNQERFVKANGGYSYIIACVDILSRVGHLSPIKSKSAHDVLKGFENLFQRTDRRPSNIRSDRGREFTNKAVREFMKNRGIHMYFTNSSTKSNYSEIFIKNIKRRLFRIFQHRISYKYIDILQDIEDSYNSTFHNSIQMSPLDVNKQNQQNVWFQQYFPPQDYKRGFKEAMKLRRRRARGAAVGGGRPFKFQVGDTVRVSYLKDAFTRDYDQRYSGEVFTVTSRRLDQGIPIYFLNDYSQEPISGAYYGWELQRVKFDPDQAFKIDKVLKTRKRGKIKESLVRFLHWPDKYNQWIPTANIETLTPK